MSDAIPTAVALVVAILGGAGGLAALLKVQADNSKTVSEGATNVVKLLRDQVTDLDQRLSVVEEYSHEMETWSVKVTDLLEKAIAQIPEVKRHPFRSEAEALGAARPRRRSTKEAQ